MNTSKNIKGIVLAGGEGKRLRPLSYYFQKCMIPVGHNQKPLLEYIIRLLSYHNINDILLLSGYKHEQISNYFNSGNRFDVNIEYLLDNPDLKGTGGSILNAYQNGLTDSCEDLIIYYGDIISNIDLTAMLKQHRKRGSIATLAVSSGFKVGVGVAEVNQGNVVGWTEKPTLKLDVGIGILILKTCVLQELKHLNKPHMNLDIMSHLIPRLIQKGKTVHAYLTNAFWYDVGSVERYEKLDNGTLEKRLGYIFPKKDVKPLLIQS